MSRFLPRHRAPTLAAIASPDERDDPRERLAALGAQALADAELIALVLRTGARGWDAPRVARGLLDHHGDLRQLSRASARELVAAHGVGRAKAASLIAAVELGRRISAGKLSTGRAIRSPHEVYRYFGSRLRDDRQESFWVLLLDGRSRVFGETAVSRGTLTASLVHPREVFRPALREAAAAVLLVHNHPSGDPAPSGEDRVVTARLAEAGELLGIRVVDHVIVAEHGFYSFREDGGLGDASTAPRGNKA